MAQTGLLEWSNSIRFNMATDPGRQLFQDQINTYGFHFLDDYLDNILSGAKQDPLIELVKTPGRKKAVSNKPKPASKLNNVASSLPDQENDKENIVPINSFHKALLAAKPPNTNDLNHARLPDQPDHVARIMAPPAATNAVPSSPERPTICSYEQDNESLAPSHTEHSELSAIAEDDENPEQSDRSCVSLQGSPSGNDVEPKESTVEVISTSQPMSIPVPLPETSFQAQVMNITTSSSDTFHSTTLDSPPSQQALKVPARSPSPLPAPVIEQKAAEPPDSKEKQPEHGVAAPLISSIPPPSHIATAAPPPVVHPVTSGLLHTQDFEAALRDDESTPLSPKGSEQNPDVSLYPVLPAPMPLRKSMRAPRDASMGAGPLGTTTPGAPLGGKRTSWLKKAREVKALEGTNRNIATLGLTGITQPHIPFLTNPLKRKSGDMVAAPAITGLEDEERHYKSAKNTDGNVAPLQPQIPQTAKGKEKEEQPPISQSSQTQTLYGEHEGMLDRLKKTVEGLGARVGKSMGKSLGAGAAGSALAEARAAAEARVAERNNKDEEITRVVAAASMPDIIAQPVQTLPTQVDERKSPAPLVLPSSSTREAERRLSVSDLFPPNDGVAKIKTKASAKTFQITPPATLGDQRNTRRETGTTTPPNSPPTSRPTSSVMPSGRVFNKPPPVFIPPAPTSKPAPAANQSSASSATTAVPETARPSPLTAQSTMESIKSDKVFDDDDDEAPAWMPSTQDTEYFGSQDGGQMNVLDDDDSWPLDEKLASGGAPWTFGGGKDDSITWSTAPSQTQKLDTVHSQKDQTSSTKDESVLNQMTRIVPSAFDVEMDVDEHEVSGMVAEDGADLEEMIMGGASTVSLVESTAPPRSQSQASMASSASSQSQAGFFGQASKLLNSALGTSKKGKPEVKKVLQMAAVAAKKQQEEDDKKAARLKDMENRRQLAIQRKAEEEKTRAQEEERKLKEEGERRKREREENTDKRPLRMAGGKKDEETTKKRKVTVETEKKPELKKPASKSTLKSAMKQQAALHSSAAYNSSLQTAANTTATFIPKLSETKPSKPSTIAIPKGKGKTPPSKAPVEDEVAQPSQLIHAQMSARAKAQLQAAKQTAEPTIQSESIELPDINSEYSDSEDEDRARTFDPPHWAQSPELRHALQVQSTINPDDIFGSVKPLKMEELFKTRTSRFRARTSSANWTGADRLTLEEEREYARRMGFR